MHDRKQQLLKAHRRRKRLVLLVAVLLLAVVGVLAPWWCVPLLLVLGWVAHEAWFSDHLFYSPGDDYNYTFAADARGQDVSLAADGRLLLAEPLAAGETLILQVQLRASLAGRWVDPYVMIGDDRQDFERGVNGRRYLNLSGQAALLEAGGLRIRGRFCQVSGPARLTVQANPDYAALPLMVLAPAVQPVPASQYRDRDPGRDRSRKPAGDGLEQGPGGGAQGALASLGQPCRTAVGRRARQPLRAIGLLLPATAGHGRAT